MAEINGANGLISGKGIRLHARSPFRDGHFVLSPPKKEAPLNIKTVLAAAASAAIAAGMLAAASPAAAQAPLTHSAQITNYLDNGSHGYWATTAFTRTVTIATWNTKTSWKVTVRDAGTFRTLKDRKSPGAGVPITTPTEGTFKGSMEIFVQSATKPDASKVKAAYNYRCDKNGTADRSVICPGMPAETGDWGKLFFAAGSGATFRTGNYSFDYRGQCGQRWIDVNGSYSGDITNGCATPATPIKPTVTAQSCKANGKVRPASMLIPRVRGVKYEIAGNAVQPGRVTVEPGRHLVKTTAEAGYVLKKGVKPSWVIPVKAVRCK
ncbi:hypothetical protein ITP53_11405 [Nonomuraea sp. K274]|uniref:Uncharacterized protein n=1 Tax=Nonomuraea cypriaca TaxID=1187855 RepID=A0A931A7B6_9ACTN|nr:hypothetical protein [Nonomuraea cypriaca]MBF8186345.1 hypothetical protein [Nonomuraea cypriaca]